MARTIRQLRPEPGREGLDAALAEIAGVLHETNRRRLPPGLRFRVASRYHDWLRIRSGRLAARLEGQGRRGDHGSWLLLAKALEELVVAYCAAIRDRIEDASFLGLALSRALDGLLWIQRLHIERYLESPGHLLWRRSGALLQIAMAAGIPVCDGAEAGIGREVRQRYLLMLLLAASNPYGLDRRKIPWLVQYLKPYTTTLPCRFHLGCPPDMRDARPPGIFLTDLNGDLGPVSLLALPTEHPWWKKSPAAPCAVLDTRMLARAVGEQLRLLREKSEDVPQPGLSHLPERARMPFLLALRNTFTPVARADGRIAAHGLGLVILPSFERIVTRLGRAWSGLGSLTGDVLTDTGDRGTEGQVWELADLHAGGMRVCARPADGERRILEPGVLLAAQVKVLAADAEPADLPGTLLVELRWRRESPGGMVILGLKRIGDRPRVVRIHGGGLPPTGLRVLLAAHGHREMLVTPIPLDGLGDRNLSLMDDDRRVPLEIGPALREHTTWCQYLVRRTPSPLPLP